MSSETCINCLTTYYYVNNKCIACITSCETCISGTECLKCLEGYYLDSSNQCVSIHIIFIIECPSKCLNKCSSDKVCEICNDGYLQVLDDCVRCTFPCKLCNTSVTHCISCVDGYYLSADGVCTACISDCI